MLTAAIEAGARICVHGDYDVDGICATALAVLLLRELGADVAWHLPVALRGGLRPERPDARRGSPRRGSTLVLTVDCGITAVAEVELRAALGLEIIVTDHHRPGDALPDCPVVAPLKGDYPFPGLCGTGVVCKLAQALLGRPTIRSSSATSTSSRWRRSPTSCRSSTRTARSPAAACAGSRRRRRPGLQALMRVAGVDPAAVDETAIGFRLAPRINAAGRLGRPEAALELLLTEDAAEADPLAEELETLNRERQAVEERILASAVEEIESWPEEQRRRRATSSPATTGTRA